MTETKETSRAYGHGQTAVTVYRDRDLVEVERLSQTPEGPRWLEWAMSEADAADLLASLSDALNGLSKMRSAPGVSDDA